MLVQERRRSIIDRINTTRMVKVTELMDEYGVSIETVRRDLEYLEKHGHLLRVYGGATLPDIYGEEPTYGSREVLNYNEKRAIGRKTAELINDGETLFMEVGTTMMEVAACLKDKKRLTVITNSTQIASVIVQNPDNHVILLGGEMRAGELATSGAIAEANLQNFYANKLIMGVGGITLTSGVTDYNIPEASLRRAMIARSKAVIAVADYSKFGVTAINYICPLSALHSLVVDWSVPQKTVSEYISNGIQVHIAPQIE